MKKQIKSMFGLVVATPLATSAMSTLSGLTGNLSGIGHATASVVGVGLLSQAKKTISWK